MKTKMNFFKQKSKLKQIKLDAKANFTPIVRPKTKKKLVQCVKTQYKHFAKTTQLNSPQMQILEIGTSVGFSGINMLLNVKNCHLTTLEKDEKVLSVAKQNFASFGLENVNFILGDAWESLNTLNSQNKTFDFIFLDGPKGQYLKYLPLLLNMLSLNGRLFIDDIYYHGCVLDSSYNDHKHRTIVRNLRALIEQISTNKALKTQIYNIEDGFAICKKIKNTNEVENE